MPMSTIIQGVITPCVGYCTPTVFVTYRVTPVCSRQRIA